MTSAKERAVEAGARSDAEFDGRSWEGLSRAERERYLARARKSQGVAFPIEVEELAMWSERQASELELLAASHVAGSPARAYRSGMSRQATLTAYNLRARIQQMAEAL